MVVRIGAPSDSNSACHERTRGRIYAALGDQDKVFEWLQKAVEDRCEWLVKPDYGCGGLWLDEAWDGLRSDPRFVKVQEATGLRWPRQPVQPGE